jgi:hypothetical protein
MTPQVELDKRERVVEADTAPSSGYVVRPAPHELTSAERQGLAMGWVSIVFGLFLLFGGLALWAAVALHAGFVGWLVSMALLGIVLVAALVAVSYTVIRPRR